MWDVGVPSRFISNDLIFCINTQHPLLPTPKEKKGPMAFFSVDNLHLIVLDGKEGVSDWHDESSFTEQQRSCHIMSVITSQTQSGVISYSFQELLWHKDRTKRRNSISKSMSKVSTSIMYQQKKNALNKAAAQSTNKGHPKRVKTLEDQTLEHTKLLTWEKWKLSHDSKPGNTWLQLT